MSEIALPAGYELLPIDAVEPNGWNPNEMDADSYNLLVEHIQTYGFTDPIKVARVGDRFRIVNGEHRWRAAKYLGMETIPAIIGPFPTEEIQKAQSVAQNVLHGKVNPKKFVKMLESLRAQYDEAFIRRMLGFSSEAAYARLLATVRRALPAEMQAKLDATRQELKTVDDLSLVLNRMFTEYGSTLEYSFMVFAFGGKEHVWVRTTRESHALVRKAMGMAVEAKRDINDLLVEALSPVVGDWVEPEVVGVPDGDVPLAGQIDAAGVAVTRKNPPQASPL